MDDEALSRDQYAREHGLPTAQERHDQQIASAERARIRQMALDRADAEAETARSQARDNLLRQTWRCHEGAATSLRELAILLEKP